MDSAIERFRIASGLDGKAEEAQVNTLLYSMGDEGDDILRSFSLSEEDQKKYNTVKAKFDGHFVKRRNTIFERAKFNSRRQEQWISSLQLCMGSPNIVTMPVYMMK